MFHRKFCVISFDGGGGGGGRLHRTGRPAENRTRTTCSNPTAHDGGNIARRSGGDCCGSLIRARRRSSAVPRNTKQTKREDKQTCEKIRSAVDKSNAGARSAVSDGNAVPRRRRRRWRRGNASVTGSREALCADRFGIFSFAVDRADRSGRKTQKNKNKRIEYRTARDEPTCSTDGAPLFNRLFRPVGLCAAICIYFVYYSRHGRLASGEQWQQQQQQRRSSRRRRGTSGTNTPRKRDWRARRPNRFASGGAGARGWRCGGRGQPEQFPVAGETLSRRLLRLRSLLCAVRFVRV